MGAVALVTDMIFAAKIKGTADQMRIPLSVVRSVQSLDDAASAGLTFAIIDLQADGVDPAEAIRCCKSMRMDDRDHAVAVASTQATSPPVVIAFGSHVRKDLMDAARQAGADLVVPRSTLSAELPDLLARYSQMLDQQ